MKTFFLPEQKAYLRYMEIPGDKPARVFLHGLGSAATADFSDLLARSPLAGRHSLLVDFLGFGFSDRPLDFSYSLEGHASTIAALLEARGLEACEVVGHSMGGSIAITLAAMYPHLVKKLVVAEGNLDPGIGSISKKISSYSEEAFLQVGFQECLDELMRLAAGVEDSLFSYYGKFQISSPYALYHSAVELLRGTRPTMRENLVALPIQKTFIFGERSLPDPDLTNLPAAGVPVLVVPNAAHSMMEDNPTGFAQALDQALK